MGKYTWGFITALGTLLLAVGALAAGPFIDNGNGTVTDQASGLVWKKCSEGQTYASGTCEGGLMAFTWQAALQQAAAVNAGTAGGNLGVTDWRLPNIKELASLVDLSRSEPAIDTGAFPTTPSMAYWTATPDAGNAAAAWFVNLNVGYSSSDAVGSELHVRLVRGGQ